MSYKLYADNRCIVNIMDKINELELASSNDLREKPGYAKVNPQEKKICNCPNCGAPVSSYICEYCGTEFEKPKKVLTDEEKRESFASFVREQKLAQMKASQEWQSQQILNTLNAYSVQTQIANIRDSINTNMHQSQTNISPYQGPKIEENDLKPKLEFSDKIFIVVTALVSVLSFLLAIAYVCL